jgi:hypothetical protein
MDIYENKIKMDRMMRWMTICGLVPLVIGVLLVFSSFIMRDGDVDNSLVKMKNGDVFDACNVVSVRAFDKEGVLGGDYGPRVVVLVGHGSYRNGGMFVFEQVYNTFDQAKVERDRIVSEVNTKRKNCND